MDIQLDLNTPLPARDQVIRNVKNKIQLIRHFCQGNQEPGVEMIAEGIYACSEMKRLMSMWLATSREFGCTSCRHIQIVSDDTDVIVLLVHFY